MGLISFVKSAGEKLFGASEAKAATVDTLHKELEKHGLDTSGVKITGSASLSVLVGLIGVSPISEPAKEHGLGSRAGRAGSWGRARGRSLGDVCGGTGSRLLSPMPRAVDTSAQPILPSSSRSPRARRRRGGEDASEPLAMSEPGVRA
jgi:hypothetical protein